MKKNNEQILKYLSGLMNESEKTQFENELQKSQVLKNEYEEIQKHLAEMIELKSASLNETYFNNLLPKVKERINSKEKIILYKRLYYLVPVTAALLITIMFWPGTEQSLSEYTSQLTDEIINNIDYESVADHAFSEVYYTNELLYDSYNNDVFSISLPDDISISKEQLYNEIDIASYDYSILNDLSEEELKSIYNKIYE